MTRNLSVVTNATPKPKAKARKPATIKAAAEMSERDLLVTMRTRVATEIDGGVPAHTLAPLMRQLRDLDKEIRALDAREDQGAEVDAAEVEDGTFDAASV